MIQISSAYTRWTVLLVALVNWVGTSLWVGIGLGGLGGHGAELFNWHPILASCAMLVLFPHGVLAWRNATGVNHAQTKLFHATLLTAAFVLLNVAVGMAYFSHRQQKLPNFYSLHSWVGMFAIGSMKGNIIGGLLSTFSSYVRNIKLVSVLHRLSGVLACALGFVAMLLGFAEEQMSIVQKSGKAFGAMAFVGGVLGITSLIVGVLVTSIVLVDQLKSEVSAITKIVDEEIPRSVERDVSQFET